MKWLYVHKFPVPLSKKEEKMVTFIRDWKIFVLWDNCLLATLGKSYQHVSFAVLNGIVVISEEVVLVEVALPRDLSGTRRARPV